MRRARELQQALGKVLLQYWDPLSVKSEEGLEDEYNAYVGPVYRLLASGASDQAISQHLAQVEATSLGYPHSQWESLLPVAHQLRVAYARLADGTPAT